MRPALTTAGNRRQRCGVREGFRNGRTVARAEAVSPAAPTPAASSPSPQQLQQQVRELQRLLGKKTLENEILKEATEVAREKKWLVRSS